MRWTWGVGRPPLVVLIAELKGARQIGGMMGGQGHAEVSSGVWVTSMGSPDCKGEGSGGGNFTIAGCLSRARRGRGRAQTVCGSGSSRYLEVGHDDGHLGAGRHQDKGSQEQEACADENRTERHDATFIPADLSKVKGANFKGGSDKRQSAALGRVNGCSVERAG